jgi:redox-sensitive bicupin YhaK (pirin superfamily)
MNQPLTATAIGSTRQIVHRTRGSQHGPVTRLMSPSDLGQLLKPFVFLDLFEAEPDAFSGFGMHPHSGIATLSLIKQGAVTYEESTGKSGLLPEGGVEWMQAGGGVWHTGGPVKGGGRVRGFQLWVALPPELENEPAQSHYLAPDDVPLAGPARVLLGSYGGAQSPIAPPSAMNYLAVKLKDGERWRYEPPAGHTIAWIALSRGSLQQAAGAASGLKTGELVVFESSQQAIEVQAQGDTEFVLGSAVPHPYPLVLGSYSVHTTHEALQAGEAGIRRLGSQLRAQQRGR